MPRDRRLRLPALTGTALTPQLTALGAVSERLEPRQETEQRRLPWLVLLHTTAGQAVWECAGHSVAHRPGTLAVLAPGVTHRQRVGAQWWQVGYLLLQGPWLASLTPALRAVGGALTLEADRPLRRAVATASEAILGAPSGWDWQAAAALSLVLARVHAACLSDDRQLTLDERLARVVDHDPAIAWSLPALARRLGLSVSSLAHRCRAETGISPAAWIRRRRAGHARSLLATGLSVTAVSERLGFANPYHFTRVIRQEFGVPPSRLVAAPAPGPLSR